MGAMGLPAWRAITRTERSDSNDLGHLASGKAEVPALVPGPLPRFVTVWPFLGTDRDALWHKGQGAQLL